MHTSFDDITKRLGAPLWWYDPSVAVPRYDEFHPTLCGVYDDHVALCVIRCQSCHKLMPVSVSLDQTSFRLRAVNKPLLPKEIQLPTVVNPGSFDRWGDPPIHDCVGDTMMSNLVKIEQFWIRSRANNISEWERRPGYEIDYSSQLIEQDAAK